MEILMEWMMFGLKFKVWGFVAICGVLSAAVLSCGAPAAVSGDQRAMTLEALHTSFGIPSRCGSAVAWEGQRVTVQGNVDPYHIYDK